MSDAARAEDRTQLGRDASAQLEGARAGLARIDNPLVIQELEGVFANLANVVEQDPPSRLPAFLLTSCRLLVLVVSTRSVL